MQNIFINLKKLGFTDHEALVYEALVQASPLSATSIAKKCNLARSSVYTTLNILISKGLVSTSFKNEVKQFVAEDFSALESLLKNEKRELDEKEKTLESMKEELQKLERNNANIPEIVVFEGQEGLKRIYLSMLRNAPKNSTLYMLRDEYVWKKEWKFIHDFEWDNLAKRIKTANNISAKLIINNSKTEKEQERYYKNKKHLIYNFLPKNAKLENFAIYIIADMVSILSMENNNLAGVKITNKNIAENFKTIFSSIKDSK